MPTKSGKPRPIKSINGLVAALGGKRHAAEWAHTGIGAMENWLEHKFIPPGWHLRLYLHLRRRGREIDPVLFGMTPEEFEVPASRGKRARRTS